MVGYRRALGLFFALVATGCGGEEGGGQGANTQAVIFPPSEDDGWFPIGPTPIDKGQVYGTPGAETAVTGRASAIAVNPAKIDEVYLGTASGGLWHTNNALDPDPVWSADIGGASEFKSLAIGAIAVVPSTCGTTGPLCHFDTGEMCGCGVVWAGTGENGRRRDTHVGAGVYRFAHRISGEIPSHMFQEVAGTSTLFKGGSIYKILPENETTAVVLFSQGVTSNNTHSTVVADPPNAEFGVYRLVDVGSGTADDLPVPGVGDAVPGDLERSPSDPQDLFVTYDKVGIFKSEDGGGSWTAATINSPPATFTHIELTISPDNAQIMYASFGTCFARTGGACGPIPIYRSKDGGTTWNPLAVMRNDDYTPGIGTPSFGSYPGYSDVLVAMPGLTTGSGGFYFGGTTVYKCTGSDADGATFTCQGIGSTQVHPDIHDIFPTGTGFNTLYVSSDGGIFSSVDGGTTFKTAGRNLASVQFNSIAAHRDTDVVIGGLQDNGAVQFLGTRTWQRYADGDGGDTLIDVVDDMGTPRFVAYSLLYDNENIGRYADGLGSSPIAQPGPADEPVAFYAQLELHPTSHNLYYGLQSLWKSTDDGVLRGDSWAQVSPILAESATVYEDIEKRNVITAIGIAKSNENYVYIGHYNGELFVSNASAMGPCNAESCWTRIAGIGATTNIPIPTGPITSIAVDPNTATIAYVTVSGFADGPHVLRNNDGTPTGWQDLTGGLATEPANVIRINPATPTELWLGTESGLYHREGEVNWVKVAGRFPSVPVYDIGVNDAKNQVIVGTHGRGAWLKTEPDVRTLEGWAMGTIWDIPIAGQGFVNTGTTDVTCTVELVQQSGTVCAVGQVDAQGGTAQITPAGGTGPGGVLKTSNGGEWDNLPVFWGCRAGTCMGGIPIDNCNFVLSGGVPTSVKDPVSQVRVNCPGSPIGVGQVSGAPAMTAPPPNIFAINVPGPLPFVDQGTDTAAAPSTGSFDLAVSLQSGDGLTRQICHTTVDFEYTEPAAVILARATEQLNEEPDCIAEPIDARFEGPIASEPGKEDQFNKIPTVSVLAPSSVGSRILVTMRVLPGAAQDVCFTADRLISATLGQATIMKIKPLTGPSGASGGTLTVSERTPVGKCTRTLTTTAGQTADDLAAAIVSAFHVAEIPGPPECLSNANARDFDGVADSVFAAFADTITLCSSDPGVGFVVGPEEIDLVFNKPPVAVCTDKTLPANSMCRASVTAADVDAGSFDPDGPPPNCVVAPTGPFGLGNHTVTLTCTDAEGAFDDCTAVVTVADQTPPVLNCPVSVNTLCTGPSGAVSTFSVTATDNCALVGSPVCSFPSGSTFPLGTRFDVCSVSDAASNASSCNFNVTVSLGDNPVCCPSGTNVILGTSNNNTLTGGTGRDCIFGRGGQDTINGNGGDDLISGGEGDDIITGGTGNDLCFGGTGQDRLSGNAGNDVMSGGDGDDQCFGGDNNDTLLGGQGQDRLFGENHDDTLVGEIGDDRLEGGSGNDSLDGDGLHDVCIGGPGTDVFLVCESQTQ